MTYVYDTAEAESNAQQRAIDTPLTRTAVIYGNSLSIHSYLPSNYTVTHHSADCTYIEGIDNRGWTLQGYVIPRLASGMYRCRETTYDVPRELECIPPNPTQPAPVPFNPETYVGTVPNGCDIVMYSPGLNPYTDGYVLFGFDEVDYAQVENPTWLFAFCKSP